jgi:hypothetical protein
MIPFDKIREEKLIQLAQERFNPELWPAEKKVLHDSASSVDPVPPNPEEERLTIRTDFVRWLATDPEAAQNIDPKGLRVWGATLHGKLDFEECRVFPTLYIRQCTLLGDINLMSAEAKGLFITKSDVFGSIQADGITVHGPISLRESTFSGEIRMLGAKLTCQGDALSLDNAKIGNNVFLSEGFESLGAIRLLNTQISGNLECIGAKVAAVYCKNMQVTGDFIWQRIKKSEDAQLKLIGAKVKNLRDDRESGSKRVTSNKISLGTHCRLTPRSESIGCCFRDRTGALSRSRGCNFVSCWRRKATTKGRNTFSLS